jgi:hypothetical protein
MAFVSPACAGESVDQLLEASMGSGWDGDSAIRAVELALGRRLIPASPKSKPESSTPTNSTAVWRLNKAQ